MNAFQSVLPVTRETEFPIGEDKNGLLVKSDLLQINHLLITGTTGSGKSVFVDSMLLTLIFHSSPRKLRLILCDTKITEFLRYNGIAHLLIPVCTNLQKISRALLWAQTEGQKRLRLFASCGVKNISSYNDYIWENNGHELPHIVIVIDDLSTVLNSSPESIDPIKSLLSIGRTAGIHIVAITQTPTVKCAKEIIPLFFSKMVFQTATPTELRFMTGQKKTPILPCPGDAIFCSGALSSQIRTITFGIEDSNDILDTARYNNYDDAVLRELEQHATEKEKGSKGVGCSAPEGLDSEYDELLPAAIEVVLEQGQASVSMLQRRLKLGYSRAARLVDQMEEKGIVGPFEGSKARQILITKEQWQEMQYKQGTECEAPALNLVFEPDCRPELKFEKKGRSEIGARFPRKKMLIEISRKNQLLGCLKVYTVSIDDCSVGQLKCGQKISFEIEEGSHKLSFLSNGKSAKEASIKIFPNDQLIKFSIELDLSGKLILYKDN